MENTLGQVERPIEAADQDRLDRSGFVGRLTDALVPPTTNRAAGVVIGVTGSWGSGKSSILNLVEVELKRRAGDTVVIRFDPWLISGRDDLIAAFLHELTAAFKAKKSRSDTISEVVGAIDGYAGHVAPAIDLISPGLGKLIKAGFGGAARLTRKDGSLFAARKRVLEAMSKVEVPVVVLIDELDRVEDSEVRTMAQLIRSVADFPKVSYLLAYDANRVAEALAGAPGDPHGRGRAYLEKIVQLPVPMPILLTEELGQLVRVELERVHRILDVEEQIRPGDHDRIIEVIIPDLANTPRDVKRMVGAYHALAGMLSGEVDLADVLGLAALTVKAPRTMEQIRATPEGYVIDPLGFTENARRSQGQPPTAPAVADGDEIANRLVLRLFPVLGGQVAIDDLSPDSISLRRNLLTALRLGLLPGDVDRETAEMVLSLPAEAVQRHLETALETDALGSLVDRLDAIYPSRAADNDIPFWIGLSKFLDDEGSLPEVHFGLKRDLADAVSQILLNAVKRRPDLRNKALHIYQTLRRCGDYSLTSRWLHRHLFVHGAMDTRHDGGAGWFISASQIEGEVRQAAQAWDNDLRGQALVRKLADQYPLLVMIKAGWTADMHYAFENQAANEIDRLARIFYGRSIITDPETIDLLVGWTKFMDWIEFRSRDERIPDDVLEAFHKARDASSGFEPKPDIPMGIRLGPREV